MGSYRDPLDWPISDQALGGRCCGGSSPALLPPVAATLLTLTVNVALSFLNFRGPAGQGLGPGQVIMAEISCFCDSAVFWFWFPGVDVPSTAASSG